MRKLPLFASWRRLAFHERACRACFASKPRRVSHVTCTRHMLTSSRCVRLRSRSCWLRARPPFTLYCRSLFFNCKVEREREGVRHPLAVPATGLFKFKQPRASEAAQQGTQLIENSKHNQHVCFLKPWLLQKLRWVFYLRLPLHTGESRLWALSWNPRGLKDKKHFMTSILTAKLVDEHYRAHLPSKVITAILSESPCFTRDDLATMKADPEILKKAGIELPDGLLHHVNLVHCLTYGEAWVLDSSVRTIKWFQLVLVCLLLYRSTT